jgi:hypothetical protein
MGELNQITDISVLAAVAVGFIYFLILLAPKIRRLFIPDKETTVPKRDTPRPDPPLPKMYPDMCAPCRQSVGETLHAVKELRSESKERDRELLAVLRELRDVLRDLALANGLRQTGDGIPVARAGRAGRGE